VKEKEEKKEEGVIGNYEMEKYSGGRGDWK
jgi:hypothetical protein